VFPYSFEPGTPATRLDGHLPEDVKLQRRDRLMQAQQAIAFEHGQARVGREIEVLVDGPDPEMAGPVVARSHPDTPGLEGVVRVKGKGLHAGDFVKVKVTAADGYDLAARALRVLR